MADIIRTRPDGHQEVRTGLGWRRVQSESEASSETTLPIIDLGDMAHPDINRRRELARTVCDAAIKCGFFYIRNHGVAATSVASILHETKRFFHELTLDEKMQYDTEKHEHYYGYYPIKLDPDQPAGAKLNEGINYGYEACADPDADAEADADADADAEAEATTRQTRNSHNNGDNWWPSETRLPGYEKNVKHYMGEMLRLSRSLLRLFALGLDLDEHSLDHLATQPYSILKMAHYPGELAGTQEPSSIRPHTDYELLTILLQDEIASLQVLSNTGRWIQATPIDGTLVVNIGDSLSMLTNGLFVSTMHRVLNTSRRARYSVPFFLGANQEAELRALDRFVTPEHPAKFQPMTSGDYIRRSLQAVYSKPNSEIVYDTLELRA
ncbi:hypothetical protein A1O3_10103 [Capronia epimyces CBS 606.96]|uniref:Fe2OG dioxygenase domain-containing protein n=1 Tax=Capronia epimyces CBS 606.96 TaxID=1182542 RepID=W9XJ08_9EURO|nr:uncharacterized protein A1O3_10103 [Capronia epimyces CBS 606.96]EXJ76946.1 hypothetical protein A1O3_10103 [Capronia epimyces CBS 606.96]